MPKESICNMSTLSDPDCPDKSVQATVETSSIGIHPGCANTQGPARFRTPTEINLRRDIRAAFEAVTNEEHQLTARNIANAIHFHKDPAGFSLTGPVPRGPSDTNDDEKLRVLINAHFKLRRYKSLKNGDDFIPATLEVHFADAKAETATAEMRNHEWTVRKSGGTSDQRTSTLASGSVSSTDRKGSESRPPPASLYPSGPLAQSRSASPSSKDRRRKMIAHARSIDASTPPYQNSIPTVPPQGSKGKGRRQLFSCLMSWTQKGKR